MQYDVWCMQEHRYVVFGQPLDRVEESAKSRSEKNPDTDYFVVKPDDTPVSHFKAGKRTDLVTEAANG